jgi:hypothetical protein
MPSAIRRVPFLLLAACLLAYAKPAWAANPAEEQAALKAAQARLKSAKTSDRAEALRRLRKCPCAGAVKIIFDRGLCDKQPDVRNAGLDTLFEFKNNPDACHELLDLVKKELDRKEPSPDVSSALAILFSSELPDAQKDSQAFLEAQLRFPPAAQRFLEDLAGVWGRNADKESLPQLVRLIKSEIVARNFAFHRSLIQSLIRFQDGTAVEALIELLADAKGEVRLDIVRHLRGVTGQKLGAGAEAWRGWWKQSKEEFRQPANYALASIESLGDGGTPMYYGLPLYAQRIVFVLDTSGSMRGLRLEAAKAELHKALEALPGSVSFSIVIFNSTVGVWQRQLVPATPESKRAAHLFVAAQPATAMTATYDALEAAFLFDAEAIYFLSDGAPTAGQIVKQDEIVAAVTRGNRGRLISLYTIGVGEELRGKSGLFLKQMAEQNFGVYRSVR